jgi:LacI family transcriptional regulator
VTTEARRITLVDVATKAGVSRTTASFVLTGRRDMRISADAEERVLQAARELQYRPNLLARSLSTNLTQTIGLISDYVASEPFAGQMIRAGIVSAIRHDHLLFVAESEGGVDLEDRLVRSMLDRGVGGFIYASMYTRRVELPSALAGQRIVCLNCIATATTPAVIPAERAAGRNVARALLRVGHRDAIYLVGETPGDVIAAGEREAGARSELSAYGVDFAGRLDCLWWPGEAYDAVRGLLASGARPTAFLCLNDRIALGTYQACAEMGLRIPADVSVISFDDSDLATWCRPGITSAALPHAEMARIAVETLLGVLPEVGTVEVPMRVVVRQSVGPPSSGQA